MRFVDATVFIRWGQATLDEALCNENVSLCGYILTKIRDGEEALTSSLVKDESLIWFSRYKASRLNDFIRSLTALTNIKIANPTLRDELEAAELYGQFPLGISDIINLAIMKRHGVNEIYTADKGFDHVPAVRRIFEELRGEPGYYNFIKELKGRR
ncbi:MAG: type II toxin-antitoxin system VapC family toxin [Candidatus Bathyarchaeia archaeon]